MFTFLDYFVKKVNILTFMLKCEKKINIFSLSNEKHASN